MISWPLIRAIIYRQRWIFLSVVTIGLLIGLVMTILQKPLYDATASVRIEIGTQSIVQGGDLEQPLNTFNYNQYIQTEKMVLASRGMAETVYDTLPASIRTQLLKDHDFTSVPAAKRDSAKRAAGTSILAGGLSTSTPTQTLVLDITYTSENPALSAAIADAYADSFMLADVRKSMESNTYALDYLRKQVDQVQREVLSMEMDANNFAKANGIVSQSMTGAGSGDSEEADSGASGNAGSGTLKGANLMSVGNDYAKARTQRIAAEQRWRAAVNTPNDQLAEVQQNSTYQALLKQRADAAGKLADLESRYGASYPGVRELKAQQAATERQMSKIASDIKQSLRSDYEVLAKQEQALYAEVGVASDATLKEQDRRVRYGGIERQAEAKRRQLRVLMDRYNQISSAANVQPSTIRKLDNAQIPFSPSSPNMAKNLLIALALGIIGGLSAAAIRELFDDQVHADVDLEHKLGLPILGLTPFNQDVLHRGGEVPSSLAEAYSAIRIAIDASLPSAQKVIQITSSQSGEGKSLTSRVLAERNASAGRKTLLIDADLRKPSVHSQFGQSLAKYGIIEILSGDKMPEEVFLPGTPENLDVVPVGPIPTNPISILSSPSFQQFIERSRETYSRIIIDSPPVLGLGDAPLISHYVDGTVFVAEANKVTVGQIRNAIKRLRAANANIVGAVLTKFKAAEAGQHYGYAYDYYGYGKES